MSQLNEGSDSEMTKFENEVGNSVWSEEHDRIPLKQRLKMLLASKPLLDVTDTKTETQATSFSKPLNSNDIIVKKEYGISVSEACNSTYQVAKGRTEIFPLGQTHGGEVGETNRQRVEEGRLTNRSQIIDEVVNSAVSRVEEDNAFATCPQQLMLSDCSVKVEPSDNDPTSSMENYASNSFGVNVQVAKVKPCVPVDSFDDLDYIVLRERQRMLFSRKLLGQPKSVLEGIAPCSPRPVIENKIRYDVGIPKGESHFCGRDCFDAGNSSYEINNTSESVSSSGIMEGSYCTIQPFAVLALPCMGSELITSGQAMNIHENSKLCSSQRNYTNCEFSGTPNLAPRSNSIMLSSPISTIVNVKVEPSENNELQIPSEKLLRNSSVVGLVSVKREAENLDEIYESMMDHMPLSERMKLLAPREVPNLNVSGNVERMGKLLPSAVDCTPVGSESTKPLKIVRYRKRKRTVTDSVETALEEDAPGLLQVLLDKGVYISEIKLYGETENDEPIDESFIEDSFSELETMIAKLFSRRQSLLKLAPIRCPKDDRACYCLACLFSLVEQARYLHFRSWPVEWGWCRDLQSFIFVFKRHNRIVLERPEYGYATYFFELMESLPINWQIKRLVTSMKLTSCGRTSLIENKALMVGEDLTEGEARVLMEYGWIPNTGLGTMLNYCDRVVHDRKSERDSSEWRSKIGKLLMDGYNGGKLISTDVPEKVMECSGADGMQIKLELQ